MGASVPEAGRLLGRLRQRILHKVIAIVGVGAIGGVCAAQLQTVRADLVCCVRRSFEALHVRGPSGEVHVRPRVETDPQRLGPASWLLLATKAHQIRGAAPWLCALIGPETTVAVLQNGVEHVARVAAWVGPERVVPVVVDCPATVLSTGRIEQRREARLTVPDLPNGRAFAALFDGTATAVRAVEDWPTAAWRKLCINSVGAIAALAGRPLTELKYEGRAELARALAHECAAVARAEGADVPGEFAEVVAERALRSDGLPSILADRLAGRPLEIEARNGAVVRFGAQHGIPTPVNARVCALLAHAHLDPQRDLLDELGA
jgi:2-dehydropantoate 2-reductase